VVVVVFENLGAAAGGVGAVAVEFGFVEKVGTGAVEDAQRAVLQAGADGGDAEGEGVDALVDGEARTAEFGDLPAGGGTVGRPCPSCATVPQRWISRALGGVSTQSAKRGGVRTPGKGGQVASGRGVRAPAPLSAGDARFVDDECLCTTKGLG
jgi:hypothetical protein